jgi:CRISPR-associated endonuclease/helicase Cas3
MMYFKYWGKAGTDEQAGASYHLLPYHCLDVAAVGWQLLAPEKPLCQQLAKQLEVDPEWLRTLFVLCLALHDLGKFSRAFQGLKPDLSPDLVKIERNMPYSERHDSLGFCLWRDVIQAFLAEEFPLAGLNHADIGLWLKNFEPWLEIVTGHHGMPPKGRLKERIQNFFEVEDEWAAKAFVLDVFKLLLDGFDFQPLLDKQLKKRLQAASWQLAGIAVLADWLGSNKEYFEYQCKPQNLDSYWNHTALPCADKAVGSLPEPPKIARLQSINSFFPFIKQQTPLQQYAVNQPLSDRPQLFILEDVTGAGKTEAALMLTHRLMSQGLADGLYVALPTMATANAMYRRLGDVYRKFYRAESKPSLILAHGARELSQDFQDSVVLEPQQIPDSNYLHGGNEDDQELSATAYCNAWLADSRKKALLADVGVGTLDQVLLAVLPARHQSLRLLGLGRKVLLVDEVHAYDSYMQKLLDALLEAHARQGGSAILLSATLPQTMRENLVKAFHKGLGEDAPELSEPAEYPLVIHTSSDTLEQAIDTRAEVKRTVNIERLDSQDEVIARILKTVDAGQCVCWIRNTVKSARQSYQDLLDAGVEPNRLSLFHSRFAMIDRLAIEDRIVAHFGNDSINEHRKGQVLIATQVVEQSLDLDFDVMITDLAPIDLVIQRAGRLRRHIRDIQGNRIRENGAQDQRGAATLYLFSPDPVTDAEAGWLKTDHAGTAAVYPHTGKLWLTAKRLTDQGKLTMPEDARVLIEGVYSGAAESDIPEALLEASFNAEGKDMTQKSMADLNVLKLNKGYTRLSSDNWDEETKIPTRLTEEETVAVVLVVVDNGRLMPYAKTGQYAWALSTVKIPEREWKKAQQYISEKLKPLIETLKAEQKALRWLEILPLEDGQLIYSSQYGFMS